MMLNKVYRVRAEPWRLRGRSHPTQCVQKHLISPPSLRHNYKSARGEPSKTENNTTRPG